MVLLIPQELNNTFRNAKHIVVLTGAGISAESGIPTFREKQTGLWSKYNPEELATPEAFRKDPDIVLRWYKWRLKIVNQAKPNPGHSALALMESIITQRGSKFTLITQNVDGLHQRAGSKNIIELHGNINRSKCFDCGSIAVENMYSNEKEPLCLSCNGLLRPDVVWFGENISPFALHASWEAAQFCDIFLSIGTSSLVQPAASLPIIAIQKGRIVIEVNPNDTPITNLVTYSIQGKAGDIMPIFIESIWPDKA